ncbi:MAG: tautomerase family protein [Nitrosopumilaceae archaeon]|nr:tautomerase family protein [Nitrosopumilaceae archaeon]
MPTITVSMKVGHSPEQKRAFAEAVTAAAVEHLEVRDTQVIVTYDEKSKDSFFRAGKQL